MAWKEKRKAKDGKIRYRIRERIDGKLVTVVKNAGQWRDLANARLTEYEKTMAAGRSNAILTARRLPIEEALDLFFKFHSGGLTPLSVRDMRYRIERIKHYWKEKMLDEINLYDIRDLLAHYRSIGDRLKYLRLLTTMFSRFQEWNEEDQGQMLGFMVKLPPLKNPARRWRKEMKPHEKKERPRERVLTPEEWQRFRTHLTPRALAICECTLRRFLRTCDIRKISYMSIVDGEIRGVQAKTGERYVVPMLDNQPKKYDFTNFRDEFLEAQKKAELHYPVGHPLHFNVRDLRRTGATWAYRKTKDLKGVSKMLGHTNTRTTELYLHIDEVDRQEIADAVDWVARGSTGGAI